MGGKRIAEQVRRAPIAATKVAPVAVVIGPSGCGCYPCAEKEEPVQFLGGYASGSGGFVPVEASSQG